MAKYLLLYEGGSMPSEEERPAVMQAWEDWFGQIGSASVVDQGNPFSPASKRVGADGSVSSGAGAGSGYSILEADSLDAAADLAKGCPVLRGGASVAVYEIFDVM
jgi:YCII-related domain